MRHEPIGFWAVHSFQRRFLLGKGCVKFVVAAALLFHAFDQGAQPVGGLEQALFFGGKQLPGDEGENLFALPCGTLTRRWKPRASTA